MADHDVSEKGLPAETDSPQRSSSSVGPIFIGAALVVWTVIGHFALTFVRFAALDTSCGSGPAHHPQVAEPAGVAGIAVAVIWAVPFVVLALVRRKAPVIVLAVIAVLVAAFAAVDVFANPASFCW